MTRRRRADWGRSARHQFDGTGSKFYLASKNLTRSLCWPMARHKARVQRTCNGGMGYVLERAIHLLRRVRQLVIQPPGEYAQQGADHVLNQHFGRYHRLDFTMRNDILDVLAQ